MKFRKLMRDLHKWPGILFLLPGLFVGITTFLLAFDQTFKLDEIKIDWLSAVNDNYKVEIKAIAVSDSVKYIGTKSGLYAFRGNNTSPIKELSGCDIRFLELFNDTLIVGAKQGLWIKTSNSIRKVLDDEVTHVTRYTANGLVVSLNKKGYKVIDFSGIKIENQLFAKNLNDHLLEYVKAEPVTLHKIVMDLHTGEAFTGKAFRPVYLAFCGISVLLLTLTGFWLVFRRKKKKSERKQD